MTDYELQSIGSTQTEIEVDGNVIESNSQTDDTVYQIETTTEQANRIVFRDSGGNGSLNTRYDDNGMEDLRYNVEFNLRIEGWFNDTDYECEIRDKNGMTVYEDDVRGTRNHTFSGTLEAVMGIGSIRIRGDVRESSYPPERDAYDFEISGLTDEQEISIEGVTTVES